MDNYENYVHVQSEAALRNLATRIPMTRTGKGRSRCRATRRKSPRSSRPRSRSGCRRRGGGDRGPGEPPRLRAGDRRRRCSVGSRRRPLSRPGDHRRRGGRHGGERAGDARRQERRSSSTKSARPPWSATCWLCSAASKTPSRSSTRDPCTDSAGACRTRNRFCFASSPEIYDALAVWAGEELRSMNGQIEFLLRQALIDAGRLARVPRERKEK